MGNNNLNLLTKDDAKLFLDNTNFWINNIDSKISFALAFYGVFTLHIFSKCNELVININEIFKTFAVILLINIILQIIMCIINILSLLFLIKGLTPKTKNTNQDISLLFWGDIAILDLNQYKTKTTQLTNDKIKNIYIEQIYTNSVICKQKCKNYNYGLKLLFIDFILFVICIFLNII